MPKEQLCLQFIFFKFVVAIYECFLLNYTLFSRRINTLDFQYGSDIEITLGSIDLDQGFLTGGKFTPLG